jgi:hypothetical protein
MSIRTLKFLIRKPKDKATFLIYTENHPALAGALSIERNYGSGKFDYTFKLPCAKYFALFTTKF